MQNKLVLNQASSIYIMNFNNHLHAKQPNQATAWGLHSIGLLLIRSINDTRGTGGLSLLCSLKQELWGQIPNPNSQICDSWGKSGKMIFYKATLTDTDWGAGVFHSDRCLPLWQLQSLWRESEWSTAIRIDMNSTAKHCISVINIHAFPLQSSAYKY